MLVLRSLLFNIVFYLNLLVWMVVALPTMVLPRGVFMGVARLWARTSLFWMRLIVGTRLEVRGRAHIPAGGCIVAAKHQSVWETFALFMVFPDPCFIYKRELAWIPVFGWFLGKARLIPVNRSGGQSAIAAMSARAQERLAEGRKIIIFVEGTRRAPGAAPAYKQGFSYLYAATQAPILPVALNSGVFWPRLKFMRRPGTVVIDILPPIPAGLPRADAFAATQAAIESASDRLLDEAGWRRGDEAIPEKRS